MDGRKDVRVEIVMLKKLQLNNNHIYEGYENSPKKTSMHYQLVIETFK